MSLAVGWGGLNMAAVWECLNEVFLVLVLAGPAGFLGLM